MTNTAGNAWLLTDFQPPDAAECRVIQQVIDIINKNTAVPCTSCRYCVDVCPKKVAIPNYFALYNSAKHAITDNISSQFVYYLNLTSTHGKAGDCIGCQKCETACPQHIEISRYLKDVSAAFDNMTLPVK